MAENKKVVITLVKSPIGGKENQKATLKALGLNKMHASVEKYETETDYRTCKCNGTGCNCAGRLRQNIRRKHTENSSR